MLWYALYALWNFSDKLFRVTCSFNLTQTTRSINFEINDRLETGLKFFSTLGSKRSFLISGTISAILRVDGTSDVDSDKLTMCVITGRSSSRQSFNNQVGIGSSSHDLDAHSLMILLISISVAGVNLFRIISHTI